MDELPEELAMVRAQGARRLHHEDADELLLGIDPEARPRVAAPVEIARRARDRRNAVRRAHREAETEGVHRGAEYASTRRGRDRDAGAQMVGGHEPDGRGAQHALAVEDAAAG